MTDPQQRVLHWLATHDDKLAALKAAAEHFNSDLTSIICRDKEENLLSVSVHARGEEAAALERWLKRREKR